MNEIVLRIPWNKKIAVRIALGVAIILPLVYIFATHRLVKYPLDFIKEPSLERTESWIVALRAGVFFKENSHPYMICVDDFTSKRIYVHTVTGAFEVTKQYYDHTGDPAGSWSVDDTGNAHLNDLFVGNILAEENPARNILDENLHFCLDVPAWFFTLSVK